MEPRAFLIALARGERVPVALLHGPDLFLLEDMVGQVTRSLLPAAADLRLSRDVLDARRDGAASIVRAATTAPLVGAERLVVARGCDGLGAEAGEALAQYVKRPARSTVLLLVAERTLAADHWLVEALPRAAVIPVMRPTGPGLVGWLRGHAAAGGVEVSEPAARLLIDLTGEDPATLAVEVEKAALVAGPDNHQVGVDDVRASTGDRRVRRVFELMRAIERRELGAAVGILQALLEAGEDPLRLLSIVTSEVRAAWQATEWLAEGRSVDEVVRALRRPGPAAAAIVARAESLPAGTARAQLMRCWDTERRLKLGTPGRAALSFLVAELCGG
jgi:DNA polymerase III delta subunit